jgi:hypothetical protein
MLIIITKDPLVTRITMMPCSVISPLLSLHIISVEIVTTNEDTKFDSVARSST